MIILFTSNTSGGIIQFIMQLMKTFNELGYPVKAIIPDESQYSIDPDYESSLIRYHKNKYLFKHDPELYRLLDLVVQFDPSMVIFADDEIISLRFLNIISSATKCILTRHDVIPHKTHFNARTILINLIKIHALRAAQASSDKVLLLSNNSLDNFYFYYSAYRDKALLLPLGAHVPDCSPRIPQELYDKKSNYFLFFGRIDKYKGLGNLISAYSSINIPTRKLVIAGNGVLTQSELSNINKNPNIILLNRFINDDEMIYLFQNAASIVLPYIEATQSGVLSMAYHFGKPVITTNLKGLTEFVEDGKTGLIVDSNDSLRDALTQLSDDGIKDKMSIMVRKYYSERLDWKKNLSQLMDKLEGSHS